MLEFKLVDALLDNIDKYEVLINPIFYTKDRYIPSNSEYDMMSFVGECTATG
jgi:putative component of membrane protein insertase Oxa1/YidC/SpoIIIJ protein YidD